MIYPLAVTLFLSILFFLYFNQVTSITKLYDKPNKRKLHKSKTSLVGGIGFMLVFSFLYFYFLFFSEKEFELFSYNNNRILSFYIISLIIFFIALYDDKFSLKNYKKLIFYTFCIFILLKLYPNLIINELLFESFNQKINLGEMSTYFTIICIVTFMTALNMYDGVDLNFAIYCITTFVLLSLISGLTIFIFFTIYLLIFSFYNYRSKIFIGETGCSIISFIIATYVIFFYQNKIIYVETVYFLMLLPINDFVRIIIVRILNGKNIFYPDKKHFHQILFLKNEKNFFFKFIILFYSTKFIFFVNNLIVEGIIILNIVYLASLILPKKI